MKVKSFIYNKKVAPYVFILPFILTFIVFFISPMIKTVIMSFEAVYPGSTVWVGLKNYQKLLSDAIFLKAVKNSFIYTIGTLLILIPIPMILACLINGKLVGEKAKGVFKTALYLPALTSIVVAGMIFRLSFSEVDGAVANQIIGFFGAGPIKWLKNPTTGWFVLFLLASWRWMGVNMLYFLSGLTNIPDELYESASIDGANAFQKFIYVTVPQLKPTIVYVLTISIYAGLAMFTETFMIWGNSSPKNMTLTIVGYLYRQGIEKSEMGYASAVGLVLFLIAMVINMIQLTLNGTFKKEEA